MFEVSNFLVDFKTPGYNTYKLLLFDSVALKYLNI